MKILQAVYSAAVLFSFLIAPLQANPQKIGLCIQHLKDTVPANNSAKRTTPRDVRVVEINDAWNEPYSSDRFKVFVPSVLSRTPRMLVEKVDFLLKELDVLAQSGRLKNLNEWIGNVVQSRDSPVMSFIAEAEYAVYVIRQNPRYVVTFEPDGGFYRGHPSDVYRLGMRQKSIDLRISDIETGEVLALREVKSSASRSDPAHNFDDAFEKVRLVHHLQVPELSSKRPVEIGLVYFYDYDPYQSVSPFYSYNILGLRNDTVKYLRDLQNYYRLPEKPFDTVTIVDFGSRRVVHVNRLNDDSLQVSDVVLPGHSFISFAPKISAADSLELRQSLERRRR